MTDAIALYGKMLAFSRLVIMTADLDIVKDNIKCLNNTKLVPVVIQSEQTLELDRLIDLLWQNNIAVIGVTDGVLTEQAKKRQLAVFPSDGQRIHRLEEVSKEQANSTPINAPVEPDCQTAITDTIILQELSDESSTDDIKYAIAVQGESAVLDVKAEEKTGLEVVSRVHSQMVRSGQSVHYIGGDLVITGSVNVGAEVATDYNLHIYGRGQGRLVAGATGDENARIFCQKFDPSLVSVAGTYCLKDDIPTEMLGGAVEVRFDKDKGLVFSKMAG